MQQYRIAAAAHGGGGIAAIRNGSGEVEVFTTGTDGTVWNYYPDPASDTGYGSVSTGLVGANVAAALDGAGHIVLFAGNNLVINYVGETGGTGAQRWSAVQTAQAAPPQSPLAISQIYAETIGGTLFVGVLTQMRSVFPGNTYSFSYSNWTQNPGVMTFTPMTLSSLNCVWSGSGAANAEFTCLDQTYLGFEIATGTVTHYPMPAIFTSLAVAALSVSGQNQYFAVLNDGNLYTLIGGGGGKNYSWAQISQGMSLRDVAAEADAAGNVHLFALGSDARIYHVTAGANGGWTDPAPIQTAQALLTAARNDGGDIELFMVGTAQASMTRMILDEESSDWESSPIEVPTSGQVEEFVSYSTDISVTDAAGAPLPAAGIQILASAQTQISVNGSTYVVDPHTPANLTANAAGRLSVTQPTSSLGVPTLEISVAGQSPVGQSTAVRQYAGVQDQLGNVTSQEMMDAKDASGAYILQDQYRNPQTTGALAQACNECMKLADTTLFALDHDPLPARARKLGVGLCMRGRTGELNRICVPPGFQSWQIDFSSGSPVFRTLTSDEAHGLLLAKRAQHQSVEGILDFFESIGDFVSGIVDGVVNVIDTVVTVVGNAVNAAITFVVDGVTYLFNTVVSFVEQAFDLIEVIFAKVKLFFEKVFEWLGFLFAWNDILRTHKVYAYTANQFLTFLGDAAGGIQSWVDAGFVTAQGQIDAVFDQLVAAVGANSAGGYVNSNEPASPLFDSAANNNILLNATVDNAGSASASVAALASGGAGAALDPIVTALQQLVTSVANLPQWQQAIDYMTNLGGGPDDIFKQLLSALLRIVQGVIKAVLLGVQAVVDALLQAMAAVIAAIQASLNEEWDIPFVSTFYSWLTDSELTTLDLFCLILAIPATVTYKALYSSAPFPDDASVQAFEASFSAQTILANSGLGANTRLSLRGAAPPPPPPSPPPPTPLGVIVLNIGGMFSTWIYGVLSAICDVVPVTGTGVVAGQVKTVTKWALAAETVGQALACPWITSSGAPSCTDKDGGTKSMWIVETVNVGIDAVFFARYDAFAKNNDTDTGVVAGFMQGVGHCVSVGIVGKYLTGWGLAGKISWVVAELARPLRLSKVATATDEISPAVMAVFDVIGFGVSGLCSFVDGIQPTPAPPAPPPPPGQANAPARITARIPGAVPLRKQPTEPQEDLC